MSDAQKLIGDIFGSDSDNDEEPVAVAVASGGYDDGFSDDDSDAVAARKGKQAFVSSLEEEHSDDEDVGTAGKEKEGPRNDGAPLDLVAPLLPLLGDNSQMKLFRKSNILSVETKPFDAHSFEQEATSYVDASGERRMKLFQNVIRWRHAFSPAGEPIKESNARFVRWSDGSLQLMLGDEVLSVVEQDTSKDKAMLYVRHPGLIQCLGNLDSKLIFRPSGLNSKSHKQLTAIVDKKHAKVNKLRKMLTMVDPVVEKEKREKVEEERNRNRTELQRKQDTVMERGGYNQMDNRGFNASYLEEEVEEFAGSNNAREAIAGARKQASMEDEDARERRILNAKRGEATAATGQKRAQRLEETDSDEEDNAPLQKPKGGGGVKDKGRAMLGSDSDSEEDVAPARGGKKRARNIQMGSDSESD